MDSIANRHIKDSPDNANDRGENLAQCKSSSKDDLEKQGHKTKHKMIPTLKLRRLTFEDIHAHIPTYLQWVHESDKIVKKLLVNGVTKLQTLVASLKRLNLPENITSETSNNGIHDKELIKRKPSNLSPKKRGRKKISKSISLNKEFTYTTIKFRCVPHQSPSSPTSASEKCKNSSRVPENYPKLRSAVKIISKVQKEQVINKTIIGLKLSKKKNQSPKTMHSQSRTSQNFAFEQQSSPTTSTTSPSSYHFAVPTIGNDR